MPTPMRNETLTLNRIPNDRLVAVSSMFWLIIGLLGTTKSSMYYSLNGIPTYWPHLSIHHLANGLVWVLITPLIYYLIRWFSQFKSPIILTAMAGIPISICQSLLTFELDIVFRWCLGFIPISQLLDITTNLPYLLSRAFSALIFYIIISGLIYTAVNYFFRSGVNYSGREARKFTEDRKYPSRLYLKQNGGFSSFSTSDIIWIKSDGNYIRIHNTNHFSMIRQTIKSLEPKLDPNLFYRLNRSSIVNVDFISELKHLYNGEYQVVLQNGQMLNTTKTFRQHLMRLKMHLEEKACG